MAYRLKVDKANVPGPLSGLKKTDISKIRSSTEKRAWEISLTESGIKTRAEIELLSKQWIETLKKPLSKEDWTLLNALIQKIGKLPAIGLCDSKARLAVMVNSIDRIPAIGLCSGKARLDLKASS